MAVAWGDVFDRYGVKTVTATDKGKGAYVPNRAQREAIAAAGIRPGTTRPSPSFNLTVLFEPSHSSVSASFYHSERSAEANRNPEPRMGQEFISAWLEVGDEVVIGNIGNQLFTLKTSNAPVETENAVGEVVRNADAGTILARAQSASGRPPRRVTERQDFVRDPYVVAAAVLRAGDRCETPGCDRPLFERDDGSHYLEVHHVVPLAEGGEDTLVNAAAICPHCHRELHYGRRRMELRRLLQAQVAAVPQRT